MNIMECWGLISLFFISFLCYILIGSGIQQKDKNKIFVGMICLFFSTLGLFMSLIHLAT